MNSALICPSGFARVISMPLITMNPIWSARCLAMSNDEFRSPPDTNGFHGRTSIWSVMADGVEAVFPCLVDAHGRPYAAVREDRVRVKVAFEHMETVDIPESGCRCARSLISISGSSKTSSLRI